MKFYIAILLLCFVNLLHTRPVKYSQDVKQRVMRYLIRYGYVDTYVASLSDAQIARKLKRFQLFANLNQTGVSDEATLNMMDKMRCGLGDPILSGLLQRRYVLQGSEWRKNVITWWLDRHSKSVGREPTIAVFKRAMKIWSSHTNITFIKNRTNPDILIRFETGYHKDPYPFDGQGGSFGHAFYPHNNKGLSGDVHFDNDEVYAVNEPKSSDEVNLLWSATHLLGHSLGLEHTNVPDSIMYPWYGNHHADLHSIDKMGIHALYGSKRNRTSPQQ